MGKTARWWHFEGERIQCDLCPRYCRLLDGQRGFCFVRTRVGDELILDTYGRSSGFCIDPIEKKPLNHFYPGTSVLSFGTAGCNLACKFCQNWEISKSREWDLLAAEASPETIAETAKSMGCRSVAFTYNDPVIFAEYAIDTAHACRETGISPVAVTAGYINAPARLEFFQSMDAANIDLKGFTDDFYRKVTGARLSTVLDTLIEVVNSTTTWVELTTLLIPGLNDSDDEINEMATWIVTELGPEIPLHFSAFHPDHRMMDIPRTPLSTLRRARMTAKEAGLRHVYTGNVHDPEGDRTTCASCGVVLIERDWYALKSYRLSSDGRCPNCNATLAGCFESEPGSFGPRRIPIRV